MNDLSSLEHIAWGQQLTLPSAKYCVFTMKIAALREKECNWWRQPSLFARSIRGCNYACTEIKGRAHTSSRLFRHPLLSSTSSSSSLDTSSFFLIYCPYSLFSLPTTDSTSLLPFHAATTLITPSSFVFSFTRQRPSGRATQSHSRSQQSTNNNDTFV